MTYTNKYHLENSQWYNSHHKEEFRLALCFLSIDGNLQSIPLSSISAYVKQEFPDVQTKMFIMFSEQKDEKYSSEGFSEFLSNWNPDLIAISIMTPHWRFIQDYLTAIKNKLPIKNFQKFVYNLKLFRKNTTGFNTLVDLFLIFVINGKL